MDINKGLLCFWIYKDDGVCVICLELLLIKRCIIFDFWKILAYMIWFWNAGFVGEKTSPPCEPLYIAKNLVNFITDFLIFF